MLHRALSLDVVSGDGFSWGKSTGQRDCWGCPGSGNTLCCHSRCFPTCPAPNSLHGRLGWRGVLAGAAAPRQGWLMEGQTRGISARGVRRLEGALGAFVNCSEG